MKNLVKSVSNQFFWIERKKKTKKFLKSHCTNLFGPMSMASIEGSFYIVLLKDDHNIFM